MTPNQVRARLIEKGSSFRQWSIANGYDPRAVGYAVNRWAGRTDRQPQGRQIFKILCELSQFIGQEIQPGLLADEKEA